MARNGSSTSETNAEGRALGKRFKDAKDPFKVVIVRDMWLTGFDVPSLHTMYVDKPMRGHGLMQAIARVNRVFKDKPGGLVVDYLGIAHELKLALATYTESGGKGRTALPQEEAVAVMLEKYEICLRLLPWVRLVGVDDRNPSTEAGSTAERAGAHPQATRWEESAVSRQSAICRRRSHSQYRTMKQCESGMT